MKLCNMTSYSAHPDAPATFAPCGWGRHESNYGTPTRLIRNMFAMRVLEALTGPADANGMHTCPIAREADGTPVKFRIGTDAEVDRPFEGDYYAAGNVCYVSKRGNQARNTGTFADVARYRAAVLRVSLTLDVPTFAEARAWWATVRPATTELGCNF